LTESKNKARYYVMETTRVWGGGVVALDKTASSKKAKEVSWVNGGTRNKGIVKE